MSALVDRFGRVATDLRVSLTDRCNLRCTYCMPEEGLDWLSRALQLTDDEVLRLVRVAVERLGVTEVRFTGGEPLIRRGLVGIVAATARLEPRPRVSITTNGLGLERLAVPLRDAGLDRVNVSLDTLDPARFVALTRRDRHADVLRGLSAAASAGPHSRKDQHRPHARHQRGRGPGFAALRACVRVSTALHRADAAGCPAPVGPAHDGHRRGDPGRARALRSAARCGFTWNGARRDLARSGARRCGRRTGPGRRYRQRDQAVLRGLRPDPVDGRRTGAELPVRDRGE